MKQEVTTKKVFLRTLGCQMNVRDSEVVCGLLVKAGCRMVERPEDADVVIFNTCSVRQHAEDKVWSEIGRYKSPSHRVTKSPVKPIIGVIGCMAQNYQEGVFERAPAVDFVVGPSDIARIPAIIKKLSAKRYTLYANKIWETEGQSRPEEIYHTGFYEDKNHAFVVISEGCSNYCSFCVVPHVRGALRHRRHQDILREIHEAVSRGITKVTLLGQNVNAYQDAALTFPKLLSLVDAIEGLKEFGFVTSHPKDTSIELFQAMAGSQKLKPYLHLPLQSGSDRILKLMNRGYTLHSYRQLITDYRKAVPDARLSTDIIVGFPSETREDFQDTYEAVKRLEFDSAYIFKYSVRPHTAAAAMPDDVPVAEKERRHRRILELQKRISKRRKANVAG